MSFVFVAQNDTPRRREAENSELITSKMNRFITSYVYIIII